MKLASIQQQLNVPKEQRNNYGKYNFRSKEDILKHLKPLLAQHNCALIISDNLHTEEGWHYVSATATLTDLASQQTISETAYAREPIQQAGMTEAQITGTAASYAQKRALCNMFLIDDGEPDADAANDGTHPSQGVVGVCKHCGKSYMFETKEAFANWVANTENPCCDAPNWSLKC